MPRKNVNWPQCYPLSYLLVSGLRHIQRSRPDTIPVSLFAALFIFLSLSKTPWMACWHAHSSLNAYLALLTGDGTLGSRTLYWSMIFSTSFCFSRRSSLSFSLDKNTGNISTKQAKAKQNLRKMFLIPFMHYLWLLATNLPAEACDHCQPDYFWISSQRESVWMLVSTWVSGGFRGGGELWTIKPGDAEKEPACFTNPR